MERADTQAVRFDERGLAPAIIQHAGTGEVLMLGYMSREALERTVATGLVWFFSRSRQQLWRKGETSGNELRVERIALDCDGDTLLIQAQPAGPTCHTGAPSCFFKEVSLPDRQELAERDSTEPERAAASNGVGERRAGAELVGELFAVILERQRQRPEGSYVTYLFEHGVDKIGKKIGEEAAEVIIAAKNRAPDEIAWEVADLWFHSLVMLAACGMTPEAVWAELAKRRGAPRRAQ